MYHRLGETDAERQSAYRALFRSRRTARDLTAIREATNKAWVLDDDRCKAQIKAKTVRWSMPLGHGGGIKSAAFRKAPKSMILTQ